MKRADLIDSVILVICAIIVLVRVAYLEYSIAPNKLLISSSCGLYVLYYSCRILYKNLKK